ncbi:hypothetical protein [Bacillus wiedmannii]|uniref:hypothetical protein n=1 Tax=Bacillus wiedmannii TaxID=1890302 RepID=UPI000BEFE316|nr:hypothetical protein [Bacillus wiedmannii]PEJ98950.1 hypothetical protein CN690_19305 [Bacillus wiedmannii]PEP24156.1 hypothetical protein CN566_23930 [Bacillus wiedmannii]PFZ34034.1 hypothetical protein COL77_30400 [Bacillus wiedmannii]PGA86137.1 hypothetical protein COL94_12495 [Bacillus wiedmannii]PHF53658.1 hypothetical protein COI40_28470 [Bacillus wiedmannii]
MNIIMYDIKNVIIKNLSKWIIWLVCLFLLCTLSLMMLNSPNTQNSSLDLWIFLVGGVPKYSQGGGIPFSWLFVHALMAFLVGDYLYNELKENSFYVLIRVQNREHWFFAKVISVIITIFLFYVTIAIALLLSSFSLNLNANAWGDYSKNLFEKEFITSTDPWGFLKISFLMCFVTSVLISLVQVLLTMIIQPLYSYIFIIIVLLMSIYITHPIFLGKYLMLLQYIDLFQKGIFTGIHVIVYEFIVILCVVTLGNIYYKKMDLL